MGQSPVAGGFTSAKIFEILKSCPSFPMRGRVPHQYKATGKIITNSIEQSPSWEANSRSAG